MARADPALLDPARYPFSCTIEPRFGDLDTNQHINNAAMAGILEEARVRFHYASGVAGAFDGLTSMVAGLDIAYLGQTYYPHALTACTAPARFGRTSYDLVILIIQQGVAVVQARCSLVLMGPDGPAPLPPGWKESLDPWLLRP